MAVRTRLKQLTPGGEKVLCLVGGHLGSLASKDVKARCRDGLEHSGQTWAVRKRELTPLSSSRWAGSITKATHDQWALARRGQLAYIQNLEAGVRTIEDRLTTARADRDAGVVHVVRGGKRLARTRHHLEAAGLTEFAWRGRWEAERWFCQADGVRQALRQRDHPYQPGRRGEHQTPRAAGSSGERPARAVRPRVPGHVRAPG